MEEFRLRVFEKRVLRGKFGPNRDEVKWEWRKLYNEELNDLYCSHNIVWLIKSRKNEMGGACSAYRERKWHTRFWWGNLREREATWKTQA